MRADEHPILNRNALKDGDVVLNFDIGADTHTRINIDALADIAVFTDKGMFAYMRLSPDARTSANLRVGRYFGCWVSENG